MVMRDKPLWVMEIEGIVLLLRDGGVGRKVLWQPFASGVWIGVGSTRKGEKREGGHAIGKPGGEE